MSAVTPPLDPRFTTLKLAERRIESLEASVSKLKQAMNASLEAIVKLSMKNLLLKNRITKIETPDAEESTITDEAIGALVTRALTFLRDIE